MQDLLWSVERQGFAQDAVLGKRVFDDLTRALKDLDCVKSIEILLSDGNENTSPVISQDGHVGISKWAIPQILKYAYKKLFNSEPKEDWEPLTRSVLLCCPDCTTAWNVRKKQLLKWSDPKAYNNELLLTGLTLQLHPKSSESFAHRRWVIWKLSEAQISKISSMLTKEVISFKDTTGTTALDADLKDENYESKDLLRENLATPKTNESTDSYDLQCPHSDQPLRTAGASNNTELCNEIQILLDMAQNEFSICKSAGERRKSNYSAWAHRSWTMDHTIMACMKTVLSNIQNPSSMVLSDEQEKQNASQRSFATQTCNTSYQIAPDCVKILGPEAQNCESSSFKDYQHNHLSRLKSGVIFDPTNEYLMNDILYSFLQILLDFVLQDFHSLGKFSERCISDISVLNAVLHCQRVTSELLLIHAKICGPKAQSKHKIPDVLKVWESSLCQNSKLLGIYGCHEALWCHRRNIITTFWKNGMAHFLESEGLSSEIRLFSRKSEEEFCSVISNPRAEDVADPKHMYLSRHLEFCKRFFPGVKHS